MITHLFKLIWNKKKENFLLMLEMLVSFMVIFAVFTLLVVYFKNYKEPMGFNYRDVWVVNYGIPEGVNGDDSVQLFQKTIRQALKSTPGVESISFASSNTPFSMSSSNTGFTFNNHREITHIYDAEPAYLGLLQGKMVQGRWFSNADDAAAIRPVILNRKLAEKFFGSQSALGKTVTSDGKKYRVIGVVENMKDKGDYDEIDYGAYVKTGKGWYGTILLKMKPGADAAFESSLFKTLSNTTGTSVEIEHLDKKLVSKNKLLLVPMIILMIVAGFLLINVALGLFGVLWYNINKRRSEIGLRRAIGATEGSVSRQLIGEAMVLATIALLVGSFFAVQFPLLNVFDLPSAVYIIALLLSVTFIYLLVVICAVYPGRQASAIYPAVALHEE